MAHETRGSRRAAAVSIRELIRNRPDGSTASAPTLAGPPTSTAIPSTSPGRAYRTVTWRAFCGGQVHPQQARHDQRRPRVRIRPVHRRARRVVGPLPLRPEPPNHLRRQVREEAVRQGIVHFAVSHRLPPLARDRTYPARNWVTI